MQDEYFMRHAIDLAENGTGWVNPNPLVGAVIVRDGQIIARGYHARCGEAHAERMALQHCADPKGATLYVTLEPCCHYGRTPPCTEAILAAGIARVVVGMLDPNPLVAGKGVAILREAGIEVKVGVLQDACREQNQIFLHYIQHKTPYVLMKYAMSMDGKIATRTGASKWISGEVSRQHVQSLRHRYRAILVGVGTVLADNPRLTCRLSGGRNPIRIICDTHLRTPLDSFVVQTAEEVPTILATSCTDETRLSWYRDLACQILVLPLGEDGHLSLPHLMQALGEQQIDSILLEGGSTLHWSFLQAGLVQKVNCYLAPKLLGGKDAKSPIGGLGVAHPDAAFQLLPPRLTALGQDILLESEVVPCSRES